MLQVAVSGGQVHVVEVPEPVLRPGGVLVATSHSLISVGTESAGLGGAGGESLLMKAVRRVDEDLQMPPKKKLPDEQIAISIGKVAPGSFCKVCGALSDALLLP